MEAIDSAFEWLSNYKSNTSAAFLVIAGLSGVGKTSLWMALCATYNFTWYEVSSMRHTKDTVRHALRNHSGYAMTMANEPVRSVLVIDDLEYLYSTRGLFTEARTVLLESRLPRILVTSSLRSTALRQFTRAIPSEQFKNVLLGPVSKDAIEAHLMKFKRATLSLCQDIARRCSGDVRHAEIMLNMSLRVGVIAVMYKDAGDEVVDDTIGHIYRGTQLALAQVFRASRVSSMTPFVWGTHRTGASCYLNCIKNLSTEGMCRISSGFTDLDIFRGFSNGAVETEFQEYAVACGIWNASLIHARVMLKWNVSANKVHKKKRSRKGHVKVDGSQQLISSYFSTQVAVHT